jgi:hypothetical protein
VIFVTVKTIDARDFASFRLMRHVPVVFVVHVPIAPFGHVPVTTAPATTSAAS